MIGKKIIDKIKKVIRKDKEIYIDIAEFYKLKQEAERRGIYLIF